MSQAAATDIGEHDGGPQLALREVGKRERNRYYRADWRCDHAPRRRQAHRPAAARGGKSIRPDLAVKNAETG